jgi:hypothetical protein
LCGLMRKKLRMEMQLGIEMTVFFLGGVESCRVNCEV